MRFLHIADLHFGKIMNERSLVKEDQPFWKERFLETAESTKADAVVIAGDVYDRSTPSSEAVKLLDEMITELSERNIKVIMTAGNHDSGVRLGFAGDILKKSGVYISGVLSQKDGIIPHVTLEDKYGEITFWMMPYIFPSLVNEVLGTEFRDYDSACRALIEHQNIDFSKRNVMVAHQNVTRDGNEAERGGSESMIAGVGGIEYTAFENFEYTALGHIHAAQYIGRKNIRYAGSPLCYHFDEAKYQNKGPVLVEINAKGEEASVEVIPIAPLHRVRVLENTFDEIIRNELKNTEGNEYLKAVVTDRRLTPEMSDELRTVAVSNGSIMMETISSYGVKTENGQDMTGNINGKKSVTELFSLFYSQMKNGADPDEKDAGIVRTIFESPDEDSEDEISDRIIKLAERQEACK